MTIRSVFVAVVLVFVSIAFTHAADPIPFRIAGYLPNYRTFEPAQATGLTDLIIFSAEPSETGELNLSRLAKTPWEKLQAYKTRERIRLILCVGGWERSKGFAKVATSEALRKTFATAAVKVCLEKRLDGIDLDWEHPQNDAEQDGYASLLVALHEAFKPHGLMLTVTMAAWQKLPMKGFEAVDGVNLMAYDHPGRHSTYELAIADVKKLIDAGVPAKKITLGLPFYGRDSKTAGQTMTYRDIVAKHQPAASINEVGTLFFNGPDLIKTKTQYVIDAKLGGVMIWEIGQDAEGDQSLLGIIREKVRKPGK